MGYVQRLLQSWFLISLVLLLSGGMSWGYATTAEWRALAVGWVRPGTTTVLILLLMSFSLDSSRLRDSFRAPLPVLWATLVNIGLLPLMAWPMSTLFSLPDFELGIMIAAVVPCTLATASVSTRQAGGNDAVSLLVTLLSNCLSVVLTPFWLKWTVAIEADIDPWPIVVNLAMTVLIPTVAGQLARWSRLGEIAVRHRVVISIAAQCLVLVIVAKTAIEAGGRLQSQSVLPGLIQFAGLATVCGGLHLVAMVIAEIGGRCLRMDRTDRIAAIFAGSQKTLPVALLLVEMSAVTGERSLPFITFPILLFHAVQLIVDTALAEQIHRWNSRMSGPSDG